jgi:hypothetical protein
MTGRAMVTDEADFYATLQQARQAVDAVQRTLQQARRGLASDVQPELRQLARLGAEAAELVSQLRTDRPH